MKIFCDELWKKKKKCRLPETIFSPGFGICRETAAEFAESPSQNWNLEQDLNKS